MPMGLCTVGMGVGFELWPVVMWLLGVRCGCVETYFVAKRHLSMCNSERTGRTHRKIGYNSVSVEWSSNSSLKLIGRRTLQ